MPSSARSLGCLALLAALLAGCATTGEVRSTRPEERQRVADAFTPLVSAAYGADARCRFATGVLEADKLDAWVVADPAAPCDLRVVVTARAVGTLTPRRLQLLLAHELGHVQSQHAMGRARQGEIQGSRTDSGYQSRLRTSGQQFNPDEEAAADGAAARTLTLAARGSDVTCLGLADFYEDIARDRKPWAEWLSRHPFPERRVDTLVKLCEGEQRRGR